VAQATDSAPRAGVTERRIGWLPFVRVSGRPRPHASITEDAITILLAAFTFFALFLDGWRHNNMIGIDTFWAMPHILMYTGLGLLGAWITVVLLRHQQGWPLDWSMVPWGYALALVALPLAAVAGPADFNWHAAFGVENQIDSTYSPPHQGLFLAGALLAAIPAASAWMRRGTSPTLRQLWPAALAMSCAVGMVSFVIHQTIPYYGAGSMTAAFQEDLVGRVDAFSAEGPHQEGLSQAVQHFGDDAFPYYFYATHHTVTGILLFSAILFGGVLLMRRRWRLPMGTLTLMFTWLAFNFPLFSQYREWKLSASLALAGLLGDLLLGALTGGPDPVRVGRIRLFALLMPTLLWGMFLLTIALFEGGLGWGATMWGGVLSTTAGYGYVLSLLIFPPYLGSLAEEVPHVAGA
jgi:hypothetical protein